MVSLILKLIALIVFSFSQKTFFIQKLPGDAHIWQINEYPVTQTCVNGVTIYHKMGQIVNVSSVAFFHILMPASDEGFQAHRAGILAVAQAQGYLAVFGLLVANHQHIGDFLVLGVANF
jgi:uncharacterized membrane protein YqhA